MAVSTGYDYGIRKGLVGKGIADSDIGYNKGTGMVTVGGQDFMKAAKNYNGTTFTTEQDFNNAWTDYQKKLQQPMTMVSGAPPKQPTQPTQQQPSYDPYTTKNPYDQQYNDLLKTLMAQAANPTPVDVNSVINSPQYAAYQANAQRAAQQGIRAAQESMGSAGFGRSTALGERAQGIQNEQDAYLNSQVLPQLIAQAQAEQQQKLQNQMAMLGQLAQQQGVHDTRFNNANTLALQQGELTGNYMSPEARATIDQIINLGEAWSAAPVEQRQALSAEANRLRSLLPGMGVDPSLFGANVSTADRRANAAKAGTRTLQGQNLDQNVLESNRNFEFQKAQQEWENAFRQGQFDWQKAQAAWENAFQEKNFQQQVKDEAARRGLQWAQLEESRKARIADDLFRQKAFDDQQAQSKYSQGLELYKATGQMPSYMSDFGIDVNGLKNPSIKDDLSAMYGLLSSGTDPKALIKQIDDKVSLGLEDRTTGDQLKASLYKLYPDLNPNAPKQEPSNLSKVINPFTRKWTLNPFEYDIWGIMK